MNLKVSWRWSILSIFCFFGKNKCNFDKKLNIILHSLKHKFIMQHIYPMLLHHSSEKKVEDLSFRCTFLKYIALPKD